MDEDRVLYETEGKIGNGNWIYLKIVSKVSNFSPAEQDTWSRIIIFFPAFI
jgi:hypothetical protein